MNRKFKTAVYEAKVRQREAKAPRKARKLKDITPKHTSLAPEPKTRITSLTPNRPSGVEPVIYIINEVLGFRQFSLRGLSAAAGE